jgi:hypothetical protein
MSLPLFALAVVVVAWVFKMLLDLTDNPTPNDTSGQSISRRDFTAAAIAASAAAGGCGE